DDVHHFHWAWTGGRRNEQGGYGVEVTPNWETVQVLDRKSSPPRLLILSSNARTSHSEAMILHPTEVNTYAAGKVPTAGEFPILFKYRFDPDGDLDIRTSARDASQLPVLPTVEVSPERAEALLRRRLATLIDSWDQRRARSKSAMAGLKRCRQL